MVEKGFIKAELARGPEVAPTQVDRLLDLEHASTLEQVIAAALQIARLSLQVSIERQPLPVRRSIVRTPVVAARALRWAGKTCPRVRSDARVEWLWDLGARRALSFGCSGCGKHLRDQLGRAAVE
jgi:hypothetical protein